MLCPLPNADKRLRSFLSLFFLLLGLQHIWSGFSLFPVVPAQLLLLFSPTQSLPLAVASIAVCSSAHSGIVCRGCSFPHSGIVHR